MQRLPEGFQMDTQHMIALTHISSMECYQFADGQRQRVIQDVSLDVAQGERVVILGTEPFEMQLLMEIIGNLKPYESGKCALIGLGMMQKKRLILSHINYVNDQKMVCDHMQGLSWLMFASKHTIKNDAKRQIFWLELMLELDLCQLCFKYIRHMSPVERMILNLMLALKTDGVLILADFSHAQVPFFYFAAMKRLFEMLTDSGKTTLLATNQCDLAQQVATHVGFLDKGRLLDYGQGAEMMERWDRRLCQIKTPVPDEACQAINTRCASLMAVCDSDGISVYGDKPDHYRKILKALEKAGVPYTSLNICEKSMEEAFKALLSQETPMEQSLLELEEQAEAVAEDDL